MNNSFKLTAVIVFLMIFLAVGYCFAAPKTDYTEVKVDVFGIKFMRPSDWKTEIMSDHCSFKSPNDKDLELVFAQLNEYFEGTIDEYLSEYKKYIKDQKNVEIESVNNFEISGMGGYYIRLKDSGEIGHILFLKDKKPFVMALKTKKNDYEKWEPILLKAVETIKFYKI